MGGDHELTLRLIASGHKGCFVGNAFVTFASGGFSTQNASLKLQEKMRRVGKFHRDRFGANMTEAEVKTLVTRYRYPRRLLSLYVASQRLLAKAFVGLPQGAWSHVLRHFNFWKYYFKCLLSC